MSVTEDTWLLRSAGVLLHPTSLPGPHGIGDIGRPALDFVDRLAAAKVGWWQMLPVHPIGLGNSPYHAQSAFAGEPLLIGLEEMVERGLLEPAEMEAVSTPQSAPVDYEQARATKSRLLRLAFARAKEHEPDPRSGEGDRPAPARPSWLADYALFRALAKRYGTESWPQWPTKLVTRQADALEEARNEHESEIAFEAFLQETFERQWSRLREHARARSVRLLGDVPIFVSLESADVWADREQFRVDARGRPEAVAGVPPDYFSETGQLWGNPLYDWRFQKRDGFRWWIERLRAQLARFDAVRLDHFIGFVRHWELPPNAENAIDGEWIAGPGKKLLHALFQALGPAPLIAEDLGTVTDEVRRLRDEFRLPGMRIIQFSFGDDEGSREHRPEEYPERVVAYTGTHDNDTTLGWYRSLEASALRGSESAAATLERVHERIGSAPPDIPWALVEILFRSRAALTICPLQDYLGLGGSARMNIPGVAGENWRWRAPLPPLDDRQIERLRTLVERTDRSGGATG